MTPEMKAYVALLKLPNESPARLTNEAQACMSMLRDYLTQAARGCHADAEIVQNIFEAIAREE